MTGPTEFSRRVGRNDEDTSDKYYALQDMFRSMQNNLPFGSTALVRVDPSDYRGQDIVPVIIARKAPCQWSHEYSRDGMFTQDDIMVWFYDLSQPEGGKVGEYLVPEKLSTDQIRAVPLTCIAGLGQGLGGYMIECSPLTTLSESTKVFVLRDGVLEDARSDVVLMSTNPMSAFSNFQPVPLSDEDQFRAPVARRMFPVGTLVKKGFRAPVMGNGQRAWRGNVQIEGKVVSVTTSRKYRRHRYRLEWEGDVNTLVLAGVESKVDEG